MSHGFLKEASTCVIETAAYVCIQYPLAAIFTMHSRMDSFDGIHRAASWPKTVGIGFKACFPLGLKCCLDHCLHHPVFHGRYSQRSLLTIVLRDVYPSNWSRLVPLETQALLKQCPPGFGGVAYPPIDACGVFPLVFLGDTSDRQELIGRGSNKELLEIFHFSPLFVHRGSVDSLLQTSYMRFHASPTNVSPRGRMAFGLFSKDFHCLTSPKVRALHQFTIVRTKRKSAPFRVGYSRVCGPICPATGQRSLFPSSHTLRPVPLPCGWDTTCVGSVGLTQLSVKKNVGDPVGVCTPVSVLNVAVPSHLRRTCSRTILVMAYQPLWPYCLHEVLC